MAWKWYDIEAYKASVGGRSYYGIVQLMGVGFYASLKFHKSGPLPDSLAPLIPGQRFYGHMDFRQMALMIDILRNEKPLRFGWSDGNPNDFHLITSSEPVGEGDGLLAEATQ